MRWLSRFSKHVLPRSRLNARAYSRVLSHSTSCDSLPYPIPPCTSLYPVPVRPTWPFQSPHGIRNSDPGILVVTASSWSKNRSLTSSLRPLCGAYTDRKVTTCWPTISFTKMIPLDSLHQKHSYTCSPFVISRPVELVPGVLALECAVATTVSGLLDTADIHFTRDSVFTTSQTLPLSVHIECSLPEFPQVLACFATVARTCLPHLTGDQAGDVTNKTFMSVGTA